MDSKYSISEPKKALSSDYLGTFLVRQNANQYACKKKTDTEEWWAIGMIANDGTYWHPLIVSNTEAYCRSYSDNYNNGNPLSNKTASFDYNGTTYYASFGAYGSSTVVPTNVSIPVYSETKSSDISHMSQILLGLHLKDGGTLPSGEDSSGNYQKVDYLRINWENKSESLKTPIDKGNLNKMDKAIADLCANLDIAHTESEVKKLDKSSANKLLSETPTWDAETGILTFKFFDGTSFSVDFNIEKIPVSFSLHSNGVLVMTTEDGTEWQANIGSMIPNYNFNNSQRIHFGKIKNADGSFAVNADILKGSITDEYLEPNYLSNITAQAQSASSSAENASTSESNALTDAKLSQSYAVGKSGIRDGEDTDNAKYYSQQASKAKQEILDSMNIAGRGLTVEYDADSQRNVFALARECVQITDWNTQFYTGFYGSGVSANGVPSDAANYGTAFFGIVLQATDSANRSSVVYQTGIVYKNSRTDFSGIKKYERVYAQGQWSSWEDTNSFRDEDKTNLDNLVSQIGNHYLKKDVPENAVFTDTVYDDTEIKTKISNLDKAKADKSETTVNMLNPTLETTTKNGITCTNNGDGTYTLNGKPTELVQFKVGALNATKGQTLALTGCDDNGTVESLKGYKVYVQDHKDDLTDTVYYINATKKAVKFTFRGSGIRDVYIQVNPGVAADNITFKPMLTTNLNATYDDFVPYTGDKGSLNWDVADLRANVGNLEDKVKTKKIQIFADASADYYREIEPIAGDVSILTPPIVVNGSENSYDPSGENYTYSKKNETTFDILDSLISSAQTTSGIKVTQRNLASFGGNYYRVSGTATADVIIPLYSVSNPFSDALWFAGNISPSMSANTFYYLISDTAGNSVEIGTDADKTQSVKLGTHSGTVTVSLVVKSGTKVTLNAVVRGGYKKQYNYYDVASRKYSDKIDNVADAVLDVKKTANFSHNIPRIVPKDITSYIADGTFYKRLNGTDGFELFEDIYVGDYIKMSRAITCPDSTNGTVGSQYVTIAGLDTMMYNGEEGKYVNYHHAVMVPGQGFEGTQHFGRRAMNATNTTEGGYVGSAMDQSVLGAVVTEGSTESGATINQQLYAEFGSHLKTTDELLSNSINTTGTNRFGTADGCSNKWAWGMRQAVLMSEVEVYGSIVWSSSGFDTGNARMQLPLFAHSRGAMNNRTSWYWLKDVASSAFFCGCNDGGYAWYGGAGGKWGCVRPRFILAA